MFKKNLVIVVGGVISLLLFLVVGGILILALASPAPAIGDNAPQQTENSH